MSQNLDALEAAFFGDDEGALYGGYGDGDGEFRHRKKFNCFARVRARKREGQLEVLAIQHRVEQGGVVPPEALDELMSQRFSQNTGEEGSPPELGSPAAAGESESPAAAGESAEAGSLEPEGGVLVRRNAGGSNNCIDSDAADAAAAAAASTAMSRGKSAVIDLSRSNP